MAVSKIFYFHPYLGKISNLTSIFFRWVETLFGEHSHFDEHIFQRGWFNHQPGDVLIVVKRSTITWIRAFVVKKLDFGAALEEVFTQTLWPICLVDKNGEKRLMEEIPNNHLGSIKPCK